MSDIETEYRIVKFINGDDVISEIRGLEDTTNDVIFLVDAYQIQTFQVPTQETQTVALKKWAPYTDDVYVPVSLRNVISISGVKNDLLQYYINIAQQQRDIGEPFMEDVEECDIKEITEAVEASEDVESLTQETMIEMLKARKSTVH